MTALPTSYCVLFKRYTVAVLLCVSGLFTGVSQAKPVDYQPAKTATIIPNKPGHTSIILRARPSFSSAKAGSVGINTQVSVLAEDKGKERLPWYRIQLPNSQQTGWIYGHYIKWTDTAIKPNENTRSVEITKVQMPVQAETQGVQPIFYRSAPTKEQSVTGSNAAAKPNQPNAATVFLDLSQTPRNATLGKEIALLKDEPGLGGNLLATLSPEQLVVITGIARVKGQSHPWYRILTQNRQTGWIYGEQVDIPLPAPDKQSTNEHQIITEGYPKTVIITTAQLVVRQTPSRAALRVDRKTLHDRVLVVGETRIRNEVWLKVQMSAQKEGWILSTYTKPMPAESPVPQNTPPPDTSRTEQAGEPPQNPDVVPPAHPPASSFRAENLKAPQTAQITRSSINIRQFPTTQAPVITRLNRQQRIIIVEKKETSEPFPWYRLQSPDGWVYGQFVSLPPSTSDQPNTEQTAYPAVIRQNNPESLLSANPQNSPVTSEATPDAPTKIARVTRASLNVRKLPSTQSPVVGSVRQHQELVILAEKQTGEKHPWYQLQSPDGWVYGQFIKLAGTTQATLTGQPMPTIEPVLTIISTQNTADTTVRLATEQNTQRRMITPKTAVINQASINLRQKPTTQSPVVSRLYKNQQVTIVAEQQTGEEHLWYQLKSPDGWVYGQFVTFSDTQATRQRPQAVEPSDTQSIIEPFTITKPAKIVGTAPKLRKTHTCGSPAIATLSAADARKVEVLALYRGREPYFWYQVQHPVHGVGWLYEEFLRFDDEKTRFPQIHLTLLDIDAQYGTTVTEAIQKLGQPAAQETEHGRLKSLATDYQSIRLTYPGLSLYFLRYFGVDHLLEVNVTDSKYPLSTFRIGMNKIDVMLQLGETSIIRGTKGDTLFYINPVSTRASLSFILDEKGNVTQIKKNAWVD